MLVWNGKEIIDHKIENLIDFLREGDVLVFNDARVIKAKFCGKILRNGIEKNGVFEFNLDQTKNGSANAIWRALCRPAKKIKVGDEVEIAKDFRVRILKKNDDGFIEIEFDCEGEELFRKIEKYGSIPLPPYIKRDQENLAEIESDQKNYQTIYAKNGVAVAAPTAGLHFDEEIFLRLKEKKVITVFVTLNVGAGTFLPVRSDKILDHKMHSEFFSISQDAAEIINKSKQIGSRIIAIGTTSLRVLESAAKKNNSGKWLVEASHGNTEIFIYPPYEFKITDGLMTNFHLPKSTLFMLVCAFVGKEEAFRIYNHAISEQYRFYSYGDGSLLLRDTAKH